MFLLPVFITFIVSVVAILVIAADYRVYSRNLRLDEMGPIFISSIIFSGFLSFILFAVGVR